MSILKFNIMVLSISILIAVSTFYGTNENSILTKEEEAVAQEEKDLTKEQIIDITSKVMNHLVQPTDENYQVLQYNSKKELVESFQPFTSLSLAKKMVDLYYKEHDNKLYIIPTETPAWFVKSNEYTMEKLSETNVMVTQTNQTDLYGVYTIHMEFQYKQDLGWILNDVTYEY